VGKMEATGHQLKTPQSEHRPACRLSLTCPQSLRCKGEEGIREKTGPLVGPQNKPQGKHWLVSHKLAGSGPVASPLCPRDAQHGWQLSQHSGHLLAGAALMLFRLTLPSQPTPS
jgi:hypothetical protein